MTASTVALNPKQLRENYLAKVAQAEANAAAAADPATRKNWQNIAETFRQLASRLR